LSRKGPKETSVAQPPSKGTFSKPLTPVRGNTPNKVTRRGNPVSDDEALKMGLSHSHLPAEFSPGECQRLDESSVAGKG